MNIKPKAMTALYPTDILFQTPYWARVKARMGLSPQVFADALGQGRADAAHLGKVLG